MRPETLARIEQCEKNVPHRFPGPIYDIGSNTKKYREHPSQNYNLGHIFPGREIFYVDKQDDPDIIDGHHIVADATDLPWNMRNSAGGVLCCELLEHVIEPLKVLKQCYKILKKDCVCIVSSLWLYPIHDPQNDYLRFTDMGLRRLMQAAGFVLIETNYEGIYDEPDWEKNSKHCSAGLTKRIGVFGVGIK